MPQSAAKHTDHGLLCAAADVQVCNWRIAKVLAEHGTRIVACETIDRMCIPFLCFGSRLVQSPTGP